MRIRNEFLSILLGATLAAACGGGGGGDTGGGTPGGTAGDGGSGGGGGSGGRDGTGSGGTGGGGSGGTGTGGGGSANSVTVAGTVVVVEGDTETPIEGATVSVYGTSLSTTSDATGDFMLDDVPVGDVFLSATAEGYWGTIDFYSVPGETSAGIQLGLATEEEIEALADLLGRTIDDADGVVDVVWDGASGDESAALGVSADDPFTFDADGVPVLQDGVIADRQGYADQVFTGVDPADSPISVTVMGTEGETDCALDAVRGTTFPVAAKAISFVYAICEPAR